MSPELPAERLSSPNIGERISVRNSGVIPLQYFEDYPDGNLAIAEVGKNIPFNIQRVYFINGLHRPEALRGKHAHRELEQIIFCINGSFTLKLDDGRSKQDVRIDTPYVGVRLGPLLWHEMTNFSPDCVILVFANDHYKEEDYIRDYGEFINLCTEVAT